MEDKDNTSGQAPAGAELANSNQPSGQSESQKASAGAQSGDAGIPKPSTMEIPVDKMQAIMDRLELLEEADAAKSTEIEVLREAAQRGRLEEAEGKRKPKGPPKATLMVHNGKVVVGFHMSKPGTPGHQYVFHPQNLIVPAGEDLKIKLDYLDGSESATVPYVEFIRTKERAQVSKVGENGVNWLVKFEDSTIYDQQLEIDPQFLNPA